MPGADAARRNDDGFSGVQARSGVGCAGKAEAGQELAPKDFRPLSGLCLTELDEGGRLIC